MIRDEWKTTMTNLSNIYNMARRSMKIDRTRTNLTRQAIFFLFSCFEEIRITCSTGNCSTYLYVQSDPLMNMNLIMLRGIPSAED